jgi:D-glycerate 3-kinase
MQIGKCRNPSGSLWPSHEQRISQERIREISRRVQKCVSENPLLDPILRDISGTLEQVFIPLAAWLEEKIRQKGRMVTAGISGALGTVKSTLCRFLEFILASGFQTHAVTLSIDDLYLTRSERIRLAGERHPLLETRGVPGTHDVELGIHIMDRLAQLSRVQTMRIPRFDKSMDDRYPEDKWAMVSGPVDILLFEGWCVGAKPQNNRALEIPINDLERIEDASGIWRRFVNDRLRTEYTRLFDKMDVLVMLKAPRFDKIIEWRTEQETILIKQKALSKRNGYHSEDRIMNRKKMKRFIQHYERLTRFMLDEMVHRADVLFHLNDDHQVVRIEIR